MRMAAEMDSRQQVRRFYDQVGWQEGESGLYQNARYEDLRPVSAEYIHRCHLRVGRHLKSSGRFLLDAGSGPVQYPEYLTYSAGYPYRVCADLSIVALKEARKRLGERGLYVVADVSNLPFREGVFDGLVSLHTLHHLPQADQEHAYGELYRVMAAGSTAVVVNGWTEAPLMRWASGLIRLVERLQYRRRGGARVRKMDDTPIPNQIDPPGAAEPPPSGTYVRKHDLRWLRQLLDGKIEYRVWVWRSVSVQFLRALVHARLGGRLGLRLLYALEERFPGFFGKNGQYPMIVLRKP